MSKKSTIALSSMLGLSAGHICMWNPLQRNRDGASYDISSPGNTMCRNTEEDVCGGVPKGRPFTSLAAGQAFDVTFQQNLNHFYVGSPGELRVDFADVPNPVESDFYGLKSLNDYNAVYHINSQFIECACCLTRSLWVLR